MRIAPLLLLLTVTSVLADSGGPSVEESAAVLTGTVLSVQKVAAETNKLEIWRAEVRVERITKQDTNLTERVFLYYEQNHFGEDGIIYMRMCPAVPQIVVGDTKMFYCIRWNAGDAKRVLFIPEGSWVTTPGPVRFNGPRRVQPKPPIES